jgi:hypothetical protein
MEEPGLLPKTALPAVIAQTLYPSGARILFGSSRVPDVVLNIEARRCGDES